MTKGTVRWVDARALVPKFSQSTRYFYGTEIDCVTMNYKVIALMVVCIAVVAAAGCMGVPSKVLEQTAGSSDASYVYSSSNAARVSSDAKMSSGGYAAPVPAATAVPTIVSGSGIETRIIKTAYITIEVTDVTGSVDLLKNLVTAKGGYLSSSSVSEGYNGRLSGTVVLRIPQAEFENTLAGVKAVGTVKSVSTQGEDVTEEYVDIQAQKTSYQNQLAQYNEIMKKAVKVSDVIEIQQQIDRVQTELNRLEGRLKYLNSRIDMSTITVTVQEPEPVGGETGHNFVTTINEGIAGFIGMIDFIIIVFLTLLPLMILSAIGYWIYRWRKKNQPAEAPAELPEKK
jgi:cbb3-type cytochrome oxidase subunit 3